jgi:predicted transcriptional regulator
LRRVLTPRRWELLRAMAGQGPLAMRKVARRVGRDVKGVHGGLHALLALLAAGLLDRKADGRQEVSAEITGSSQPDGCGVVVLFFLQFAKSPCYNKKRY